MTDGLLFLDKARSHSHTPLCELAIHIILTKHRERGTHTRKSTVVQVTNNTLRCPSLYEQASVFLRQPQPPYCPCTIMELRSLHGIPFVCSQLGAPSWGFLEPSISQRRRRTSRLRKWGEIRSIMCVILRLAMQRVLQETTFLLLPVLLAQAEAVGLWISNASIVVHLIIRTDSGRPGWRYIKEIIYYSVWIIWLVGCFLDTECARDKVDQDLLRRSIVSEGLGLSSCHACSLNNGMVTGPSILLSLFPWWSTSQHENWQEANIIHGEMYSPYILPNACNNAS